MRGWEMMKIVVYDLEMLCDRMMHFEDMQTIRIGAAKMDMESNKIELFDEMVKPLGNPKVSTYCQLLTKISQQDINKADTFPQVFQRFLQWIGPLEETTLVSWGANDLKRLQHEFTLHKLDATLLQHVEKQHADLQQHFHARGSQQRSIEYVLGLYGMNFIGVKHNPKYDAFNTLRIYMEMKRQPHYTEALKLEEAIFKSDSFGNYTKRIAQKLDQHTMDKSDIQHEIACEVKKRLSDELETVQTQFQNQMEWKELRKFHRKLISIKKRFENVFTMNQMLVNTHLFYKEMNKLNRYIDTVKFYIKEMQMVV